VFDGYCYILIVTRHIGVASIKKNAYNQFPHTGLYLDQCIVVNGSAVRDIFHSRKFLVSDIFRLSLYGFMKDVVYVPLTATASGQL
jgi:hypothetical protein